MWFTEPPKDEVKWPVVDKDKTEKTPIYNDTVRKVMEKKVKDKKKRKEGETK